MVQATEGARASTGTPSADDVVQALNSVLHVYKRTMTNPDERARVFVLAELHRNGPARLTDLAELVGLDGSTVSRHVSGLVGAGLVERSRDPEDARAQRLQLTAPGRAYLDRVRAARATTFETAMRTWSPTDRRRLVRLLTRLGQDLTLSADPTEPHS